MLKQLKIRLPASFPYFAWRPLNTNLTPPPFICIKNLDILELWFYYSIGKKRLRKGVSNLWSNCLYSQ